MYQNNKSTRQVINRSKRSQSSDDQYYYYDQGVNSWRIMLKEDRGKSRNLILNFMRSKFLLMKQSKKFQVVYEKIVPESRYKLL